MSSRARARKFITAAIPVTVRIIKNWRKPSAQLITFIIGIGAYEPRWFMKANHNNPADAFQAFQDAEAKTLIPMHYGTFDLSDEPPSQPLKLLKQAAENAGQFDKLKPLQINESFEF